MAWSRFSTADLYTFPNMEGRLECCSCLLMPDCATFTTGDVETFLAHIDHHRDAGHHFPADLPARIAAEAPSYVGAGSGS